MNNLGTVAVIRHNGSAVVYNKNDKGYSDELVRKMVANEMKRNQAKYESEKSWNAMILEDRNDLLAEKLYNTINVTPKPIYKRILNNVANAIDFVYACIIVWSEALGFIEEVKDEDDEVWW